MKQTSYTFSVCVTIESEPEKTELCHLIEDALRSAMVDLLKPVNHQITLTDLEVIHENTTEIDL